MKIVFIGGGKMVEVIMLVLFRSEVIDVDDFFVFDISGFCCWELYEFLGVHVMYDNCYFVYEGDVVFLVVKF